MTDRLSFAVAGTPAPQGSKSAVPGPRGRPVVLEGRTAGQRARFHAWRSLVAQEAWVAMTRARRTTPMLGPVAVELLFVHPRPKSTPAGHRWRHKTPDLDKLARAVLDALVTGGVIGDDAQVARLVCDKVLALPTEGSGCVVTVSQLDHTHGPADASERLPATDTPGGPVRTADGAQRARRRAS